MLTPVDRRLIMATSTMDSSRPAKVSDLEREEVAQQLKRALVGGRIDYPDFEARMERALSAVSYTELSELVVDLPVKAPTPLPQPARRDHLPINAAMWAVESASATEEIELESPRAIVTIGMGLQATLLLAALAAAVRELIVDVLPSAGTPVAVLALAGTVVIALLVVYLFAATLAAIPRRRASGRRRSAPPGA